MPGETEKELEERIAALDRLIGKAAERQKARENREVARQELATQAALKAPLEEAWRGTGPGRGNRNPERPPGRDPQ